MKFNWKKTSIITLILLLVAGTVVIIAPKLVITMYNRFFGKISECKSFADFMNMLTTGRYNLWLETLNFLGHHPIRLIFGCGLGAPVLSTLSAHNAFISMVYQLGLVGSILLIILFALIIKQILKKCKLPKSIFIPIVVILCILMVEDTIFYINKF